MNVNEYQQEAKRTSPPTIDGMDALLFSMVGLNGEAGEAIDIIKKVKWHGHEFDREKFILELGDCSWYIARACTALGIDFSEVLEKNIAKLKRRYPEGFSTQASIARGDTKEAATNEQ